MKDTEVISRISNGDEKALDYLYRKYYKMMVRMVVSNNGSEEEAKDIYQEALIVFWQKVSSRNLVLTSKISTYLYSICLNLWRKELDRKSRIQEGEKEESEIIDHDKAERIRIVNDCINALGDNCKRILTYYYFDGLSMNEIADKLGYATTDTAKTKKYKCKKKLDLLIKSRYKASDFLD